LKQKNNEQLQHEKYFEQWMQRSILLKNVLDYFCLILVCNSSPLESCQNAYKLVPKIILKNSVQVVLFIQVKLPLRTIYNLN